MANNRERHRYYEEHREEIVANLKTTGLRATSKKWNIPRSSINTLLARWLTQEERDAIPRRRGRPSARQKRSSLPRPANAHQPKFPDFSNEWAPPVQLKWLELYEKLFSHDHGSTPTPHNLVGYADL